MALLLLCKLTLQTHMCSHPVGLDVWFWLDPLSTSILYVCEQWRLWRAFAGHLCYKYHNLMSWLVYHNSDRTGILLWWCIISSSNPFLNFIDTWCVMENHVFWMPFLWLLTQFEDTLYSNGKFLFLLKYWNTQLEVYFSSIFLLSIFILHKGKHGVTMCIIMILSFRTDRSDQTG